MKKAALLASMVLLLIPGRLLADDEEEEHEHGRCTSPDSKNAYACREVIVEYDSAFDWQLLADRYGLRLIGVIPQLRQAWFEAPEGTDVPALIESLILDLGLSPGRVQRNQELAPPECRQLTIGALGLSTGTIDAFISQPALRTVRAHPDRTSLGKGVVVAVLDTGISRSHALFGSSLAPAGIDLVAGTALADDTGDGIDGDGDGVVDKGYGHGTAVAGLIHALAPGAILLPVRVLDDECQGTSFALAKGIVEAVDAGARVINVSLGAEAAGEGDEDDEEEDEGDVVAEAVEYATRRDVLLVAPSGNRVEPSWEDPQVQFPASQKSAVAVAAVDASLVAPAWTVPGEEIALSAPGVELIGPYRAAWAVLSGSSFSTAIVSGAAAVARGVSPCLRRKQVLSRLKATAIPVDLANPLLRGDLGAGVPDVDALLRGWAPVCGPARRNDLPTPHREDDLEAPGGSSSRSR